MTDRAYDPELAPLIPSLPELMDWDDVPAMRKQMNEMIEAFAGGQADPEGVRYEDHMIAGPEGAPELRVRVYTPEGEGEVWPALLYIHGGGFCLGNIETEHFGAAAAALAAEAVVVSVDYRLAPEDPFPAGLEDCYASLCWMTGRAAELGIDPEHVAVMGGSAGGGLAAGVALLARDRGGPKLCYQVLNIPELDDRLETPSMKQFTDTPLWNRPNAIMSWRHYLGDALGGDVSHYAAPSRAEDLSGLPPAYVSTMEYDPLRDEGIRYALRMLEHGVSVELHQFPGTFHGSSLIASAEVSRRSGSEMLAALRRGLRG
ncbi:MAG: alpha/beta hydrolase [Deltaproteobacteria bacterium]|nr:alpha/beta hydrolase [Deltaproteobacteria bacterium]MBW2420578.1 alpha/beta hydrolase [Deltaproteobacteria bacterium]